MGEDLECIQILNEFRNQIFFQHWVQCMGEDFECSGKSNICMHLAHYVGEDLTCIQKSNLECIGHTRWRKNLPMDVFRSQMCFFIEDTGTLECNLMSNIFMH